VELVVRLGADDVWEVEHHFLEEYGHSSASEVFLAACLQRTKRIRLGHGIVQLPVGFNHRPGVAERIATLALVCDGRVEFGTGDASPEAELGGFGVDRNTRREQRLEAIDAVTPQAPRISSRSGFGGGSPRAFTSSSLRDSAAWPQDSIATFLERHLSQLGFTSRVGPSAAFGPCWSTITTRS